MKLHVERIAHHGAKTLARWLGGSVGYFEPKKRAAVVGTFFGAQLLGLRDSTAAWWLTVNPSEKVNWDDDIFPVEK